MASGRIPTESDAAKLREMWSWFERMVRGRSPKTPEVVNYQAPDIHVAKPQSSGGIPGLTPGSPDSVNSDLCDVYSINDDGDLKNVNFAQIVYNLSEADIGQDWIIIVKDKFGDWFAPTTKPSQATMIKASVNEAGDVAASDSIFNIDNVTIIQPEGANTYAPDDNDTAPTVCQNTFGVPALDDAVVIAWYDFPGEEWHGLPELDTTECP